MADNDITIKINLNDLTGAGLAKIRGEINGVDDAGKKATASSSAFGSALGSVGKIAAGFVVAKVLSDLPGTLLRGVDSAIALDAGMRKVSTVFGDSEGTVRAWAEEFAHGMGLSVDSAQLLAAGMGDLLIPLGATREEAAKMSTDVIGLAGALSQWTGGTRTAEQVSFSLTKALLGEREELKTLGISITEADVKARILANGQDHLTGSARQLAEAQATMQLIYEKSTDAQAAYAAGGDTAVRAQAELKAEMAELRQELEAGLIPVFQAVVPVMLDVLDVIGQLSELHVGVDAWNDFSAAIRNGAADMAGWAVTVLQALKSVIEGYNSVPLVPNIDTGGIDKAIAAVQGVGNAWREAAQGGIEFAGIIRVVGEEGRRSAGASFELAEGTQAAAGGLEGVNAAAEVAAGALRIHEAAALAGAAAADILTAATQAGIAAFQGSREATNNLIISELELKLKRMEAAGATDEETQSVRDAIAAKENENAVIDTGQQLLTDFTAAVVAGIDPTYLWGTQVNFSAGESEIFNAHLVDMATSLDDAGVAAGLGRDILATYGDKADTVAGDVLTLLQANKDATVTVDDLGNAVIHLPNGKDIVIDENAWEAIQELIGVTDTVNGIPRSVFISISTNAAAAVYDAMQQLAQLANAGHARGTNNAPRGMAWVGEQGPELVRFKGGEQVFNASQSRAMASGHGGGGGGDETIQLVVDGRVLAEVVNRHNARDMRAAGLFRGG